MSTAASIIETSFPRLLLQPDRFSKDELVRAERVASQGEYDKRRRTTAMANRPNFLFIITDQHRADHLGCYGNPVVRTSNIDRLASTSTRFDRCYVATSICMPTRSTLM